MFTFTLLVFFISGFAALLYQVAWQRMLVIFSGADVYSATIVVSAYMAGLGLGSLVGGQVADRVRARTSQHRSVSTGRVRPQSDLQQDEQRRGPVTFGGAPGV